MSNTIFLDLYGTIVAKGEFGVALARIGLTKFLEPKFLENSIKGLKQMSDSRLVLISNQAAINYHIISDKNFKLYLERFDKTLKKEGINFEGIYYCPHRDKDKCKCRKPETGMLEQAVKELNIDLTSAWFIGDQTCDILTGKRMNLKTILLETGYAGKDKKFDAIPDYKAKDLYDAAIIINNQKRGG